MNKPKTSSELMSLDIAGIVQEAQQTSSEQDKLELNSVNTAPQQERETSNFSPQSPESWEKFISYISGFKTNTISSTRRRTYQIEENILETLESCNIQNSSVTNIINAALRTFIDEHKHYLRNSLKSKPSLILE